MSCVSLDLSRNPSRGKAHSIRMGSLSWASKISSRERKFSSIPTPGSTGIYDCVFILRLNETKGRSKQDIFSEMLSKDHSRTASVYNSSSLLFGARTCWPIGALLWCLDKSNRIDSIQVKNSCSPTFWCVFSFNIVHFSILYVKIIFSVIITVVQSFPMVKWVTECNSPLFWGSRVQLRRQPLEVRILPSHIKNPFVSYVIWQPWSWK